MSMRIAITGEPFRAAVLGAYLTRYCGGESCVLAPVSDASNGVVLLRPDYRDFHAGVGLDADAVGRMTGAKPAFAYEVSAGGTQHCIPFAPFGTAAFGSDFHQHWLRANAMAEQPPLEAFNPALTLHRAGEVDAAEVGMDCGVWCPRADYADLLLMHAEAMGARVCNKVTIGDADLTIECLLDSSVATVWQQNLVKVACDTAIPGEEWQTLHNLARRLAAMLVPPEHADVERREFNRLCAAESERIADFRDLLLSEEPRMTEHSALRRKIKVFEACGRIPAEDYEVFAPHEWLAALWSRGMRPIRHERLAERMPQEQVLAWMQHVHRGVQDLAKRGLAA